MNSAAYTRGVVLWLWLVFAVVVFVIFGAGCPAAAGGSGGDDVVIFRVVVFVFDHLLLWNELDVTSQTIFVRRWRR